MSTLSENRPHSPLGPPPSHQTSTAAMEDDGFNAFSDTVRAANNAAAATEKSEFPFVASWDQFSELGSPLPDWVLRGLYGRGYEGPSPIQSKAILPLIRGRDIIAQAPSGTGKTCTFCTAALSNLILTQDANGKDNSPTCQILILNCTRELTEQIATELTSLATFAPGGENGESGVRIKVLVGGTSVDEDVRSLMTSSPHIIVGSCGRTSDMLIRGHIDLKNVRMLIIDEVDDMLKDGFRYQIDNILERIPKFAMKMQATATTQGTATTQVALFSATMPAEMINLFRKYVTNPVEICIPPEELTLKGITQYQIPIVVPPGDNDDLVKVAVLKLIFENVSVTQCIIYANSVSRVEALSHELEKDNFKLRTFHGNMLKHERQSAFKDFVDGKVPILVSTDLTARGINVQQVSLIINFDLPSSQQTYLHRIGRSGRFGRKGEAINLVVHGNRIDQARINNIIEHYQLGSLPVPEYAQGLAETAAITPVAPYRERDRERERERE